MSGPDRITTRVDRTASDRNVKQVAAPRTRVAPNILTAGSSEAGVDAQNRIVIVDVADMVVSADPRDVLISYSLGSCLGVTIHDPVAGVGGMIHCMLPLSRTDRDKAAQKPCMFVDTGMMVFLEKLFDLGLRKKRAVVKIAGAARTLEKSGLFRVGERNCAVLRKILWKNGMLIAAEDVGGDITRSIRLEIDSGRFYIKTARRMREL